MILLPLLTTLLSLLNASAFLLFSAGDGLQAFILCSSIHAATTWIYSWVVPAATGYDPARLRDVRSLQIMVLCVGSGLTLILEPGVVGLLFVAIMIVDCLAFPSAILVYASETRKYLLMDLARGVLNGAMLLGNLLLFGGIAELHVAAGLLIAISISGAMWVSGLHRPPRIGPFVPANMLSILRAAASQKRFQALVSARSIEIVSLAYLNHHGLLQLMLGLKLGLALSSSLSAMARRFAALHLAIIFTGAYWGLILMISLGNRVSLPLWPETLKLVVADRFLAVFPIALLCFLLTVWGLMSSKTSGTSDG